MIFFIKETFKFLQKKKEEKMTKIPLFGGPLAQKTHSKICGPKYPPETPLPLEFQDDASYLVEYEA